MDIMIKSFFLLILITTYTFGDKDYENVLKNFEIIPTLKLKTKFTRSLNKSQSLEFKIFNRHFVTKLHEAPELISPHFRVIEIDEHDSRHKRHLDISILTGTIRDYQNGIDEGSVRLVSAKSNVLRMNIMLGLENIIVEYKNMSSMIVYRSSDIINGDHDIKGYSHCANIDSHNRINHNSEMQDSISNYKSVESSDSFDINSNNESSTKNIKKKKRSPKNCPRPRFKLCPILLVADYQFHKNIFGGGDIVHTTSYLLGLIDDINRIYLNHKFLECGSGYGFQIKDIVIHTAYSRSSNHYNIKRIMSPEDILMRFGSKYNTPDLTEFCLGHLFVARSLKSNNSNVLGLSNVAGSQIRRGRTSSGGICSTTPVTENGFTYQTNTGLTSFFNSNGKRVLSMQAALVLAHELGHNWGSHHDPDFSTECAPSHTHPGNYIMYPFSVTGIEPNNKKFSNCSLREIRDVLKAKAELCFVDNDSNNQIICGNFRVEGTEECDVKLTTNDACCSACKLKPNAVCSDKNHKCCTNCQFATNSTVCVSESNCTHPVYCTGKNTICSKAIPKNEGGKCLTSSESDGICKLGVCLNYREFLGHEDCLCDGELACLICCKNSEHPQCSPFLSFNNSAYEFLPDQTPCSIGYCYNGTCVKSVAQPLQRIWSLIEIKDIFSLIKFIQSNIVATIIFLSLVVWIPVSCFVSHIDRKKLQREANLNINFTEDDFIGRDIKISKKIKDI